MYAATDCTSALSDVEDARDGVEVEEGVVEEVEDDCWSRRRCSFSSCSCRWRAWCCWRSNWRWLTLGAKEVMDPEEVDSEICCFSAGGEEDEEVDCEGVKGEIEEEEEEEEAAETEIEAVAILRLSLSMMPVVMFLKNGDDEEGVDVVGDARDNRENAGEGDKGEEGDGI